MGQCRRCLLPDRVFSDSFIRIISTPELTVPNLGNVSGNYGSGLDKSNFNRRMIDFG